MSSAAVLATLDEFENSDILERTRHLSEIFVEGLRRLKETGIICKVRGEGMVFGIECGQVGSTSPNEVANAVVERCYLGNDSNDGIHILGPLSGCVLRVAPPMSMTDDEAEHSLAMLYDFVADVGRQLS